MILNKQQSYRFMLIGLFALIATSDASAFDSRLEASNKYRIAEEAIKLGNYQMAISYFIEANLLYVYEDFYYNVAVCYDWLTNYDQALSNYYAYLNLYPNGRLVSIVNTRINEILNAPTKKVWIYLEVKGDGQPEKVLVDVRQPPAMTFGLYPQWWMQ